MADELDNVMAFLEKSKKLFNPEATDEIVKIINGDTTNLLNLQNVKHQWAHDIFDVIYGNNWLPHKVPMQNDKSLIKKLTPEELKAFKTILCFLVFLDSIQTNNLPNIAEFITAPDIVYVLARQTYDEAIHSKSYGWIFASLFSKAEAQEIVYEWRTNELLLLRCKDITEQYEVFRQNKNDKTFVQVVIANYLLEGLFFYNSFQFFHNLASRGLMIGTSTQIRYIQRDEIQHCNIFKNIFNELRAECPELIQECLPMVYKMFEDAVAWEIKFSQATIGNQILGMSCQAIEDYTFFLANRRLKDIRLEQIFDKRKDPYKHLELIASVEDETTNRSNNFEVTSISYKNPSVLSGWGEL